MRFGGLAGILAVALACTPEVHEQCRIVEQNVQAPAMPVEFAHVDATLIERAGCMANEVRRLQGPLARSFRIYFAYDTLPLLCTRLEQARQLAASGHLREAGKKYQALLVASQVVELAIAVHSFSEYADNTGVPAGRIQHALMEHGAQYGAWVESLGHWTTRVNAQVPKLRVAKIIWDVGMLTVATYEAAGTAAELAGRPPIPPAAYLAEAGGIAAARMSPASYVELADAIRKLVATGALDAGVVVALSRLTGVGAAGPPLPDLPTGFQASAADQNAAATGTPRGGTLRFSQTTASPVFSNEGSMSGRSINQVAADLRSGTLKPSQVPVEVIVRDGNRLIVNTRSALALKEVGIPESQWNLVDRTGTPEVEEAISQRLARNGLGNAGTDVIRITGSGPNASTYR